MLANCEGLVKCRNSCYSEAMAKKTAVIAIFALAFSTAISPARVVECYCTDTQGDRIELGEVICLRVGGRDFRAKCEMSLNVPMWRDTGLSCLTG